VPPAPPVVSTVPRAMLLSNLRSLLKVPSRARRTPEPKLSRNTWRKAADKILVRRIIVATGPSNKGLKQTRISLRSTRAA
jgi:hypothetical protein